MLIAKTPYRLSLFGGGSDSRKELDSNGHYVLNVAINQYSYCMVRLLPDFFEKKHRFIYSKVEELNSISESSHPVIRVIIDFLKCKEPQGLEIIHSGDLPSRSGIGSSSSFTVGLLNVLSSLLKNESLSAKQLATGAIEIERDMLLEGGGIQDQVCAAFGGVSLFQYSNQEGIIHKVPEYHNKLSKIIENNLYMGYVPTNRNSHEVISSIRKEASNNKLMKDLIHELSIVNQKSIHKIKSSENIYTTICSGLNEASLLKHKILELVNQSFPNEIQEYLKVKPFDAFKFMGSGVGGFLYCLNNEQIPKKDLHKLLPSVKVWNQVKVSQTGSKIINYD